jgi:hypothetical protein
MEECMYVCMETCSQWTALVSTILLVRAHLQAQAAAKADSLKADIPVGRVILLIVIPPLLLLYLDFIYIMCSMNVLCVTHKYCYILSIIYTLSILVVGNRQHFSLICLSLFVVSCNVCMWKQYTNISSSLCYLTPQRKEPAHPSPPVATTVSVDT